MKLNGEMVYLWRAVDHEGKMLESYVTGTRGKATALAFIKKGAEAARLARNHHDRRPAQLRRGNG